MVQLSCSMMGRYEIGNRRPKTVRAALFGANRATLGVAARLLDAVNGRDGDLGAVCFAPAAGALRAQDCMFTLLVRGESEDGEALREERVVQSILEAVDPEVEFDAFLERARLPQLELCFLSDEASAVEVALLARFLHSRWSANLPAPCTLLLSDDPQPGAAQNLRRALAAIARDWSGGAEFANWLDSAKFQSTLAETICGRPSKAEQERAQREMNYRDDFLTWAEPQLRCTVEGGAPEALASACADDDFDLARERKLRIFDALVFLCASLGFLSGTTHFAETLRDEKLREYIARAFYDEILPALPWPREEIAPCVISAFARLENPMNEAPLLELGRNLLSLFPKTLLPAVRNYAEREFDAPPRLSLALSAAIMMYAGARENERGEYEVQQGAESFVLRDEEEVLREFSRFAPDMPAETLAYAALADRDLWGEDLREIDGLEQSVSMNIANIQQLEPEEAT